MTTPSDLIKLTPEERGEYGFVRIKDVAFDAVQRLWRRRSAEGVSQTDLADALGKDTGWVSKNLRGPGNWTLRTFGALVEGLGGEAQIVVRALEDPLPILSNYHAYAEYEVGTNAQSVPLQPNAASSQQNAVTNLRPQKKTPVHMITMLSS